MTIRGDQPGIGTKNLGSVFDAHVRHEFVDHDADATMETMVTEPYLLHVPTLTGGTGANQVRQFYEKYFVGKWPADTTDSKTLPAVGKEQTRTLLDSSLPLNLSIKADRD